ncbi:MAG: hypothetical protein ACYSSI_09210 [Planctomycetota bacterium]
MSMNRKQKLSVICGVAAAAFGIFNKILDFYHPGLDIYLVVVAMITAGCVYLFKDKKDEQVQNNRDIRQSITDENQ